MKILFVLTEVPSPPSNGVRIVTFNFIRLMKKAGHDVAIAVLAAPAAADDEKELDSFCKAYDIQHCIYESKSRVEILFSVFSSFFLLSPTYVKRFYSPIFKKKLKLLIQRFDPDAIHFDLIGMAQYVGLMELKAKKILSINDSYALTLSEAIRNGSVKKLQLPFRLFQLKQARHYERQTYSRFDSVHVVAKNDKEYLLNLNPKISCVVISNGVDQSLIDFKRINSQSRKNIVFVGKLDEFNLSYIDLFLSQVWPAVVAEHPDAVFRVVGKKTPNISPLLAKYDSAVGVEFVGYVENISDVYRPSSIAIVPVDKTCGIVNKALEGMAAGLAVVGFKNSFSGIIGARLDETHLEVDSYDEMAVVLLQLLSEPEKVSEMGMAARRLIRERYIWSSRMESVENMYSGI